MDATRNLITNHLEIPADAAPHGEIQAAAEIPFSALDELAEEVGAEKIPVHTLSRIGWHYTKADPSRTRQSYRILAAFRPWGGSGDTVTRGITPSLLNRAAITKGGGLPAVR